MAALIISTASNWETVRAQIEAATNAQQLHAAGVGVQVAMGNINGFEE